MLARIFKHLVCPKLTAKDVNEMLNVSFSVIAVEEIAEIAEILFTLFMTVSNLMQNVKQQFFFSYLFWLNISSKMKIRSLYT